MIHAAAPTAMAIKLKSGTNTAALPLNGIVSSHSKLEPLELFHYIADGRFSQVLALHK